MTSWAQCNFPKAFAAINLKPILLSEGHEEHVCSVHLDVSVSPPPLTYSHVPSLCQRQIIALTHNLQNSVYLILEVCDRVKFMLQC